jgi:hypothetical protein
MKKDPWAGVLTVVLVATTLGAAAKCYQFLRVSSDNRILNEHVARVNQSRARINAFSIELNDYVKSHPAIEPLIDRLNIRAPATNSNLPRP